MKIIKKIAISLTIFGLMAVTVPVQGVTNTEDFSIQIKELQAELNQLINLYEKLAEENLNGAVDQVNENVDEKEEALDKTEEIDKIEKTDCILTRNLYPGISGADVKCMQEYLNKAGYTLAQTGAGSPGNETLYYGSRTQSAVKAWQDANNIVYGAWGGYFGPVSRAKYETL